MNTDTDITEPTAYDLLDNLTQEYAFNREDLASTLKEMEAQLQAVRDNFLGELKMLAASTGQAKDRLAGHVEQHPELFVKPRSVQLHGIKCGYQSVPEKVEPGPNTVELIRKHFPEAADTLIEVKETPIKRALRDLSRGDRQRVGCTTLDAKEQVLIKPTGDAIEKLVDKIIEDASASEG